MVVLFSCVDPVNWTRFDPTSNQHLNAFHVFIYLFHFSSQP